MMGGGRQPWVKLGSGVEILTEGVTQVIAHKLPADNVWHLLHDALDLPVADIR